MPRGTAAGDAAATPGRLQQGARGSVLYATGTGACPRICRGGPAQADVYYVYCVFTLWRID